MFDTNLIAENTPRSPILAMVDLLKQHDPEGVRLLIARHLASCVHQRDSEEIFYWAVIHHGVFGGSVDQDVHIELIQALSRASDGAA